LGLVANSLVEAHGKPVFLWGREGGETIKGSCRSVAGVNLVELMASAQGRSASDGGVFIDFGGHTASGGFSLEEERVHELPAKLAAAYEAVAAKGAVSEEVVVDRELELAEAPHVLRALQRLAPFGVGFSKPLFIFPRVSIADAKMFGKAQDHLDLTLAKGSERMSGISFFSKPSSFTKQVSVGDRVDVVGHVELDWRGKPRIRVVDIL
jgi:single-stranded-DNA-specific exonuclease